MKAIITVLGKDRVGIIARVCVYLSDNGINILDINQTITGGYFNMMMIVDMPRADSEFGRHADALAGLGADIGVEIRLQHEDIFNSMHRI